MLGALRVVVSDDAAGFGAELVDGGGDGSEVGQFWAGGHDVEDVGV